MNCYRHPAALSTAFCNTCAKPICRECRDDVAGYAMCPACVAAAQSELGKSSSTVDAGMGAREPAVFVDDADRCGGGQYLKAVLFSAVAAVIGAVIWDKIVLVTHMQLGIIAIALGALVGVAIRVGAEGRPGAGLPWIGASWPASPSCSATHSWRTMSSSKTRRLLGRSRPCR
jgi:hypothetical protein